MIVLVRKIDNVVVGCAENADSITSDEETRIVETDSPVICGQVYDAATKAFASPPASAKAGVGEPAEPKS